MKKNIFKLLNFFKLMGMLLFASLCCFIILACDQAPIYYHISIEPPKKDPTIPGSPTNIIHIENDAIYVASKNNKRIFKNDSSGWLEITNPGGYLIDIATDGTKLYALVYEGDIMDSTMIKVYNPDPNIKTWGSEEFSLKDHSIQSIYGAGNKIFAGSQYTKDGAIKYAILYFNGAGLEIIKEDVTLLSGAAEKSGVGIFLTTMGNGIFLINQASYSNVDQIKIDLVSPIPGTEDIHINGIIETGFEIIATGLDDSGSGSLYIYDPGAGTFTAESAGINLTGAMCVWKQYEPVDPENPNPVLDWKPRLLLLGIRGSTNNQGYREILFDTATGLHSTPIAVRIPGDETPTSVTDRAVFNASIGKHPVQAILQAPVEIFSPASQEDLPIFASTSIDGLWSYRDEKWNAEE